MYDSSITHRKGIVYQSGIKHKDYKYRVTNNFTDVSSGKQIVNNMRNTIFWRKKLPYYSLDLNNLKPTDLKSISLQIMHPF